MLDRMMLGIPFIEDQVKRDELTKKFFEIDQSWANLHKETFELYVEARKVLMKEGRNLDKVLQGILSSNR